MKKIIPAIIAKSQKEFDGRFSKIENLSRVFHLDIMDGKFVKNHSLDFDLTLPRKKYQIHLMVRDPKSYIEIIHGKAETIIFHIESLKNREGVEKIINLIRKKKRKVWIAINPKTSVKRIEKYLKMIDGVLVMTVSPGKYGAKFLPGNLKKVREIRKLNKRIKICVDGGIDDKTIFRAKRAGADFFTVGSYLQKAKNPKEALKELKTKL